MQGPQGPVGPAGPSVHSKLSNLDYESSGHTGFASAQMVDELWNYITLLENRINDLERRLAV